MKKPEHSFQLINIIQKKKLPHQLQEAIDFWFNEQQ